MHLSIRNLFHKSSKNRNPHMTTEKTIPTSSHDNDEDENVIYCRYDSQNGHITGTVIRDNDRFEF